MFYCVLGESVLRMFTYINAAADGVPLMCTKLSLRRKIPDAGIFKISSSVTAKTPPEPQRSQQRHAQSVTWLLVGVSVTVAPPLARMAKERMDGTKSSICTEQLELTGSHTHKRCRFPK